MIDRDQTWQMAQTGVIDGTHVVMRFVNVCLTNKTWLISWNMIFIIAFCLSYFIIKEICKYLFNQWNLND